MQTNLKWNIYNNLVFTLNNNISFVKDAPISRRRQRWESEKPIPLTGFGTGASYSYSVLVSTSSLFSISTFVSISIFSLLFFYFFFFWRVWHGQVGSVRWYLPIGVSGLLWVRLADTDSQRLIRPVRCGAALAGERVKSNLIEFIRL